MHFNSLSFLRVSLICAICYCSTIRFLKLEENSYSVKTAMGCTKEAMVSICSDIDAEQSFIFSNKHIISRRFVLMKASDYRANQANSNKDWKKDKSSANSFEALFLAESPSFNEDEILQLNLFKENTKKSLKSANTGVKFSTDSTFHKFDENCFETMPTSPSLSLANTKKYLNSNGCGIRNILRPCFYHENHFNILFEHYGSDTFLEANDFNLKSINKYERLDYVSSSSEFDENECMIVEEVCETGKESENDNECIRHEDFFQFKANKKFSPGIVSSIFNDLPNDNSNENSSFVFQLYQLRLIKADTNECYVFYLFQNERTLFLHCATIFSKFEQGHVESTVNSNCLTFMIYPEIEYHGHSSVEYENQEEKNMLKNQDFKRKMNPKLYYSSSDFDIYDFSDVKPEITETSSDVKPEITESTSDEQKLTLETKDESKPKSSTKFFPAFALLFVFSFLIPKALLSYAFDD